jgi:hypothetical protein
MALLRCRPWCPTWSRSATSSTVRPCSAGTRRRRLRPSSTGSGWDGAVVADTGRLLRLPGERVRRSPSAPSSTGCPSRRRQACPGRRPTARCTPAGTTYTWPVSPPWCGPRPGSTPAAPLVAILQPREEGVDSGADDVIEEGGLEGVEAVVAAHRAAAGRDRCDRGDAGAGERRLGHLRIEVTGRGGPPATRTRSTTRCWLSRRSSWPYSGRPSHRPDRRRRLHGHPGAGRHRRQRRTDAGGVLRHRPRCDPTTVRPPIARSRRSHRR